MGQENDRGLRIGMGGALYAEVSIAIVSGLWRCEGEDMKIVQ